MDQSFLDRALRELATKKNPVGQYCNIQMLSRSTSPFKSSDDRRTFNAFYRVRRGISWQEQYFGLVPFVKQLTMARLSSAEMVESTARKLGENLESAGLKGRIESSFCSKLVATYDPHAVVYDSIVMGYFDIRASHSTSHKEVKIRLLGEAYKDLTERVAGIRDSKWGKCWIDMFDNHFGDTHDIHLITPTKKVDFLIWAGARPVRQQTS